MKLRYSTTSPYVRKVTVLALETGLDGRIERIVTDTGDPSSDHDKDNPLGKVPALILDDGDKLYDSPVICEYLDSLHGGSKVLPPPGPDRWRALRQQALADGILDAAVLRMLERKRRPEPLRWDAWIVLQGRKIRTALDQLESEAEGLAGPLTIGQIAVACALGYLDFRAPDDEWRTGRPALAAWYAAFAERPSMQATAPREAG